MARKPRRNSHKFARVDSFLMSDVRSAFHRAQTEGIAHTPTAFADEGIDKKASLHRSEHRLQLLLIQMAHIAADGRGHLGAAHQLAHGHFAQRAEGVVHAHIAFE